MRFKTDKQRKAVMSQLSRYQTENRNKGRYVVGKALTSSESSTPTKRDKIYTDEDGNRRIRLWNTDIAIINPKENTIELNSGGWQTTTTKDRINRVIAPTGNTIVQRQNKWYVVNRDGEAQPFNDGMKLRY